MKAVVRRRLLWGAVSVLLALLGSRVAIGQGQEGPGRALKGGMKFAVVPQPGPP
jgi:hypothetical protein